MWMQKLSETYDNSQTQIGYSDQPKQRPLLPICHITQQAHIEIMIDGNGNFRRARVITDKSDSVTIIPSTEGSGSRSGSKPENHPLCDKLQYVAGDYTKYGGTVTSGFSKDPEEPYRNFVETLTKWCDSEFGHPKAHAVLMYAKKKTVVNDLIEQQILFVGSNRTFLSKEDVKREKNAQDIFSVVDPQENAFVRWVVEISGEPESRVWRDKTLWESWIKYYLSDRKDKSLCLVTGEYQVLTNNHPKYIRREGDGAKLISANDTSGFTFRGRFLTDEQACGVGLEVSHKSHYALSWLISRQGYLRGDLAIVAWATSGAPVPQPTDTPLDMLFGDTPTEQDLNAYTAQETGIQLKKRIAGYGKALKATDKVIVIALDSAISGRGRMAITYYRDLAESDFLQRIDDWHESCAWFHHYGEIRDKQSGKTIKNNVPFIGAPAPDDIAETAYGSRLDDKLRKATVTRLLPCIVDGQPIPRDLVESAVRRASNRVGIYNHDDKKYHGDEEYTWKKTLSIACALFKKFKQGKEKYDMSLDETRRTRDYLYGRLLAIADVLEERALYKGEQKRATNAARYMQQFSQRPLRTWKQIHDSLTPYILRLGGAYYYKNLIAEVEGLFDPDDFMRDKPLTGEYLLGYYCQRQKLLEKKDKSSSDKGESNDESSEN
jgi:CRISPR-associated protein Csd1